MFAQRNQLQRLLCITTHHRKQSTVAAVSAAAESDVSSTEWNQAKSYNDIPKVGMFEFARYMLPGGKFTKDDIPDIFLDLRQKYGPIYRLGGIMGRSDMLITHDPSHFSRIFRVEGVWPERPGSDVVQYYRSVLRKDFYQGIEGLVATKGEGWGNFRSTVNPVLMQPKTVRLYYKKMSQVNREFIDHIREIRDNTTFEVPATFEEEINRWTLESVSVVALDEQLGLIKNNRNNPRAKKLFDKINEFFKLSAVIEFSPPLWKYIATPTYKKLIKNLDETKEITLSYITEAFDRLEKESSQKPEHEMSVLEKLCRIDKRVATVMAMDMMLAGVDTTSSTFTACLLCMAQNPLRQAKLREEVMRILPQKDSEFTEESMKNVPYLRACIKEALRIYPLVPVNARVIKSNLVLNGYQIPKETTILMYSYGLLTMEENFSRGKEYLPERWLRNTNESVEGECPHALKASNPFVFLPFGFGSRMCIGKRIVEMELELGLARLIRNFHVEYNYPTEKPFRSQLINVPNIPLKFKFTDV